VSAPGAGCRVPGAAWSVLSAWCRVLGTWCLVPGASCLVLAQTPQRPGQMPTLPLTQLDERALAADLDNRTFTLTFAQPVPVKDLLLLLVRGTNLSVVPDPAIGGSFIGELKNVTVRQALGLILTPLGLDYSVDGNIIRVFRREPSTRIFDVNYIASERSGAAMIGGVGAAGGDPAAPSFANVSTATKADLFVDLTRGVQTLLSERAAFNVDRKAGLLQVTDFPERLDRVALYLETVHDRVHRQVQIDARVVEVELNDEKAPSLDWAGLAAQLMADQSPAERAAARPTLTGMRVIDVQKLLGLMAAQGKLLVMASPRLVTLNNEPAIVRTDAITISVTPQIAPDSAVMLSVSPIVKAPVVAESDMLARVADGETLVIPGFTRDREVRERRNLGISGGWFGRGTVVTRKRVEVVILLTPKIL
jgi:type II secretory pathway component GspD/PulD (secretin)